MTRLIYLNWCSTLKISTFDCAGAPIGSKNDTVRRFDPRLKVLCL